MIQTQRNFITATLATAAFVIFRPDELDGVRVTAANADGTGAGSICFCQPYGDVFPPGGNGVMDVDDMLCSLDCFMGIAPCALEADIWPCEGGDGQCDVDDVLVSLDAFSGVFACDDSCPLPDCCPCDGNLNGDNFVDIQDYVRLLQCMGSVPPPDDPCHRADINCDGQVDMRDGDVIFCSMFSYSGTPLICCGG